MFITLLRGICWRGCNMGITSCRGRKILLIFRLNLFSASWCGLLRDLNHTSMFILSKFFQGLSLRTKMATTMFRFWGNKTCKFKMQCLGFNLLRDGIIYGYKWLGYGIPLALRRFWLQNPFNELEIFINRHAICDRQNEWKFIRSCWEFIPPQS
jgi:hypothetical protein